MHRWIQNRVGVGLKWALPTTVYFAAALVVHIATYPRFVIASVSFTTCAIVGALWVMMGLCMYAAAFVSLRKGFGRRKMLVTHGLYAILRHPLYASSIFFIIPGVALIFHSWLLLPTPVVAYVAFRIVIPAEDRNLHEQYGQEFDRYRERTNAIFPIPRRGGKRS